MSRTTGSVHRGKVRGMVGTTMALALLSSVALPVAARLMVTDRDPSPLAKPTQVAHPSLPVAFERNEGQANSEVSFVARGSGLDLALGATKASFSIGNVAKGTPARVALSLLGANPDANMAPTDVLASKSNYFVGNDPAKWRTNVPNYARVVAKAVYPGIDLAWYSRGAGTAGLEYDFLVAPGADPGTIAFSLEGASSVTVGADGDLVARLDGGAALRQHRPIAYQIDTAGQKVPVEASFHVDGAQVRFSLGVVDPTLPLVIDPVVEWSTYYGRNWWDFGNSLGLDAAGNVYVAGTTNGQVDTTDGSINEHEGRQDIFVAKFSPSGGLLYGTIVGGTTFEENFLAPDSLSVSPTGIVHVVGRTVSPDFPAVKPVDACPTNGFGNIWDAFAFKLDPTGSVLKYSTCLGGGGQEKAFGSALDSAGNLIVVGTTTTKGFPAVSNLNMGSGGKCLKHPVTPDPGDAFVTKLSPKGKILFSSCWGGAGNDIANAVDVDAAGMAYVVGTTDSTNLTEKNNAGVQTGRGNAAAMSGFVLKVTTNKVYPAAKFSSYLQGDGADGLQAVAVAADGGVFLGGRAGSTDFATKWPSAAAGAYQTANAGGDTDAFVAKLRFEAAAPHALLMDRVTYLGGTANDVLWAASLAGSSVWVAGDSTSSDFPSVSGLGVCDTDNAMVATLDDTLSSVSFASCYGGTTGDDSGRGIAIDTAGNAYFAGFTQSSDFPLLNAYDSSCAPCDFGPDAFIVKLAPDT